MAIHIDSKQFLQALERENAAKGKNTVQPDSLASTKEKYRPKTARGHSLFSRPAHAIIFRILVGLLAYILLGAGWLVGAVGDSVYDIGQRMHRAKWNIS